MASCEQPAPVTALKQANPTQLNALPGASWLLAQSAIAFRANPGTGLGLTRSDCPASVSETAATQETLFAD